MKCPNCHSDVLPGARFCHQCGFNLPAACPACSATILPGSKFCSQCGTRLDSASLGIPPSSGQGSEPGAKRTSAPPPTIAGSTGAFFTSAAYERRQVTILFVDVIGYSTLSEKLDPEEVADIMRGCYPCLVEPVQRQAGTVVQVMGDGLLAFFGAPLAHEDDPERAIRAGLDIQRCIQGYAARLLVERNLPDFNVRVGIHTGLVVVGAFIPEKGYDYSALGDAVNLAARLQQNAPPGGVLVSHETFRHVRGLFNATTQEPMTVKGRQQLVQTYLVTSAKPHAWRIRTGGVEGVETRMIGREPEFAALQEHFSEVVQEGESSLILISGEPGLGKSRLLNEFIAWVDLQPEGVWYFSGRGTPATQNSPYAVFRDLFALRFEILESDSAAQALGKFRHGMADYLEQDQCDLVGQLVGFDFSASPAVRHLLGNPSFGQLAVRYLASYFRQLSSEPVLIILEDFNWADDSSLDLALQLISAPEIRLKGQARLMMVCAARQTLFERHPGWGQSAPGFHNLNLKALAEADSYRLVEEILKKAECIPDEVARRVVEETEGNPLFIEELIKMLIEDGVIDTTNEPWQVHAGRLAAVRVPPTLTGILQARLDGLTPGERGVLQRAAVIGRIFWDLLVQAITHDPQEAALTTRRLASLNERELIHRHEPSSISRAVEYHFKHSLLQEAAYETVLLKERRKYHSQVAEWIENNAGQRLDEYLVLIAGNYALADQPLKAADWYTRAGERAAEQGAPHEARTLFSRALDLIPAHDRSRRWRALLGRDGVLGTMGESQARQADDAALLALAHEMEDERNLAEAYYRTGFQAHRTGNNTQALLCYEKGLDHARRGDCQAEIAQILPLKIISLVQLGDLATAADLAEPALELAKSTGDPSILMRALTNVSIFYTASGDLARAALLNQQMVDINRRTGDRLGEVYGMANLGYSYLMLGRYTQGRQALERGLAGATELAARSLAAYVRLNLGLACWRLGDLAPAQAYLETGCAELQTIGDEMGLSSGQFYLGLVQESAGNVDLAMACYAQAQQGFTRLENLPAGVEALAGQARLYQAQGDLAEAQKLADQVLDYLEKHSPQGMELPLLAYQSCASVFQAAGDLLRARHAAELGQIELLRRAARISDPAWRQVYLEAAPEHNQLSILLSPG